MIGTLSGKHAVYRFFNEGNYQGFTLYKPSNAFSYNMEFRSTGVPFSYDSVYYYDRNRYVMNKLDDNLKITSIISIGYTFGNSSWGIQKVYEDGSFFINNNGYNIFSADGEYLFFFSQHKNRVK